MNEDLAWQYLSGKDADDAGRAIDFLQKRYTSLLSDYLARAYPLINGDERDDILSVVFLKLWQCGSRYRFTSQHQARALLNRFLHNRCLDLYRSKKSRPTISSEQIADTQYEPATSIDVADEVVNRAFLRQLVHEADVLWLGLDPSLLPTTHVRQLVAASMYYIDHATVREIVTALGRSTPPEEEPLTVQTVNRWIHQTPILRLLAFKQLYLDRIRLVSHLLDLEETVADRDILELWRVATGASTRIAGAGRFSWEQAAVVISRYYFTDSADSIIRGKVGAVAGLGLSSSELETMLEMLRARLPHRELSEQLACRYRSEPGIDSVEALSKPPLWERLAFQYAYLEEIARLDVLERTKPAAEAAGYALSLSLLDQWISNKRLSNKLRDHWQAQYGEPLHV